MVPLTTRTRRDADSRAGGNRTGAAAVELPLGPMTAAERVARVASGLAAATAAGQPEAAAAVLRLLGRLPDRVQAPLVRLMYGRRFFHLIASVLAGTRRRLHLAGHPLTTVYPAVLAADRVGLAVGFLQWGAVQAVGVTADPDLVPDADRLPALLGAALERMAR